MQHATSNAVNGRLKSFDGASADTPFEISCAANRGKGIGESRVGTRRVLSRVVGGSGGGAAASGAGWGAPASRCRATRPRPQGSRPREAGSRSGPRARVGAVRWHPPACGSTTHESAALVVARLGRWGGVGGECSELHPVNVGRPDVTCARGPSPLGVWRWCTGCVEVLLRRGPGGWGGAPSGELRPHATAPGGRRR